MHDGEWLNDNIITAAQFLLKKEYPKVGGVQSIAVLLTMAFAPEGGKSNTQH